MSGMCDAALAALRASEKTMLTPAEVAPVLGCKPYSINVQAQHDPAALGFPVCVLGRRVLIPREPFISWCTVLAARAGRKNEPQAQEGGAV